MPIAGLLDRSPRTRPARLDARPLLRRVRPAADRAKRRDRPRPQSARLHHLDGRRRRQRGRLLRRDRRDRLQGGREQGQRPRPARHDPAPAWGSSTRGSPTATTAATSASPTSRGPSSATSSPDGSEGRLEGPAKNSRMPVWQARGKFSGFSVVVKKGPRHRKIDSACLSIWRCQNRPVVRKKSWKIFFVWEHSRVRFRERIREGGRMKDDSSSQFDSCV